MEFRDSGAEVMGQGLFKNRFAVIVAVLVGVALIGICVLGLYLTGLFPPGRRTAANNPQATATRLTIAMATATGAPTAATGQALSDSATATDTPVVIPTAGSTPTPTVPPPPANTKPPAAGAPPAKAPAGIYVTKIRVDPPHPIKNDGINFYVTFVNPTGQTENHNLCVETWRPGDKKSFGITYCPSQPIPPGTTEIKIGNWVVTGIHQWIPVRARAISQDDHDNRYPYYQANGSDLWLDFSVCP